MDWNLIFSGLTAIGTIGAVLVALFQEPVKKWTKRPVLEVTFENKPRWKVETSVLNNLPLPAIWFRLRVKNVGKSMARDIEGKLISILHPDGKTSREDIDPMELHWVGINLPTINLNPEELEYLDVFFIFKEIENSRYESVLNETGNSSNNDYLRLDRIHLYPLDRTPRNITFDPGRDDYTIKITLYSSNANSVQKSYKLKNSKNNNIEMEEI